VFESVSFDLRPGDALVLRGPNGSGKSSLLRLLAGFLRPAAGRLTWDGADLHADLATHQARLHFLGHQDAVKPLLSVEENLRYAAALDGRTLPDAALEVLGLSTLRAMPCRFLSAGQKRRVALSRLVAAPRPLWLLDEPGVGLDRASRGRLEAMLEAHRAAAGIVVAASHGDIAVADALTLDFGG
jgi:heme exporter protein A